MKRFLVLEENQDPREIYWEAAYEIEAANYEEAAIGYVKHGEEYGEGVFAGGVGEIALNVREEGSNIAYRVIVEAYETINYHLISEEDFEC